MAEDTPGDGRGDRNVGGKGTMPYEFSKIEDALEAIAAGRVVIVVDDGPRENEGDFIAAADRVTPEVIEFMITQGAGWSACRSCPTWRTGLSLRPVIDRDTAPRTPFAVQVDHRSCRTGVGPATERALTVRSIIDPATRPSDLVRPGHVFPLVAREGGVLRRAGHTEATVDLARLAGFEPSE